MLAVSIFVILGGLYYNAMRNTILTSVEITDVRIVTSDGLGTYKSGVDGVDIGKLFRGTEIFVIDLNHSSRLVHVSFAQARWKDANLKDRPSRLQSKNYRMVLFLLVESDHALLDIFHMNVGEKHVSPKLHIDIAFYDPDKGALVCLNTILEEGSYGFFDIRINSTASEPPQLLRDEGHIELTRVSEDEWVLDVDAWFVSYHRPSWEHILKDYLKLSLNLTIIRKRAM